MGEYKNEGAGGRLKRGRGKRRKLHHKRGKMSANSTKISAAYMNGGGKTWSQRHGGRGRVVELHNTYITMHISATMLLFWMDDQSLPQRLNLECSGLFNPCHFHT